MYEIVLNEASCICGYSCCLASSKSTGITPEFMSPWLDLVLGWDIRYFKPVMPLYFLMISPVMTSLTNSGNYSMLYLLFLSLAISSYSYSWRANGGSKFRFIGYVIPSFILYLRVTNILYMIVTSIL